MKSKSLVVKSYCSLRRRSPSGLAFGCRLAPRRGLWLASCLGNGGNEGEVGWLWAGTTAHTSFDFEGVVLSCPESGQESTTPSGLRAVRALVPGLTTDGPDSGAHHRRSRVRIPPPPLKLEKSLEIDARVEPRKPGALVRSGSVKRRSSIRLAPIDEPRDLSGSLRPACHGSRGRNA